MQDAQFLQDLEQLPNYSETVETLRAAAVTHYSQLYALMRDEGAHDKLRETACWVMRTLSQKVDKRKAVPALLIALKSQSDSIRVAAAHGLDGMKSKRAIEPLLHIALDRNDNVEVREGAVYAVATMKNARVTEAMRQIAMDTTEHPLLRGVAIEWGYTFEPETYMDDYVQLLGDESADVRFWAAFRMASSWGDMLPALEAIDRVAALDHSVPEHWHWHVDREALMAVENIYWRLLTGQQPETNGEFIYIHPYLISPAAEYMTFNMRHGRWRDQEPIPEPPVTLRIEPTWLAAQLQQTWPGIQFNVRQPRPQTYVLDWILTIEGETLIGGLHRDQYAVVLTSTKDEAIYTFTARYRSIIAAEEKLYLYEWAEMDTPLTSGMNAADVAEAHEAPKVFARPEVEQADTNEK